MARWRGPKRSTQDEWRVGGKQQQQQQAHHPLRRHALEHTSMHSMHAAPGCDRPLAPLYSTLGLKPGPMCLLCTSPISIAQHQHQHQHQDPDPLHLSANLGAGRALLPFLGRSGAGQEHAATTVKDDGRRSHTPTLRRAPPLPIRCFSRTVWHCISSPTRQRLAQG